MSKLTRITSYFIYGLNALLVFFWFYTDQITVPNWLRTFGRMHPMVLHLPIGFFVMAVVIILFKNQFKPKAFRKSLALILTFTALITAITALAGIVLSREGGYNNETLQDHLNFGVILSLLLTILSSFSFKKEISNIQFAFIWIGFGAIIITGHFGATLTHGNDYLLLADNKTPDDSITVFTKAVFPVFEKKCGACHNENKKKGELVLLSKSGIMQGGEDGQVINLSSPSESAILQRIQLELEHDDHMPPSGKPQLTALELELLNQWILKGADFDKLFNAVNNDSLTLLSMKVLDSYEKTAIREYEFDFVPSEEIESLNSPFRTVSQISTDEPALKASYYLASYFSPADLNALKPIHLQLVELNLAGMPINDNDVDKILEFRNLRFLNLNNTNITNEGVDRLKNLFNLEKLSLTGTKIEPSILKSLAGFKSLQEVFIWNTSVDENDLKDVAELNKNIKWNPGYLPKEDEILKLTPPILVNQSFLLKSDETITLKHNLPGTTIRITLDGMEPDSINGSIYSKPISILDHTTIKTMATKKGWYKSNTLEFNFYMTGIKPNRTELLSTPSKNYKANGAESLSDNNLGDADNFRDGNWLGFRENKLIADFFFNESDKPKKLTLVYNRNIGSYLMPPEVVEIWGGENTSSLRLLGTIRPDQPKKYLPTKTESISYTLSQSFPLIRVIGTPVNKLPSWHSGKGEKGWLMVSEIIFR